MKMNELFSKTCDLSMALGHQKINQLPRCLEITVDKSLQFAFNAHKQTVKTSEGEDVPPFSIFFRWNGWPVGLCNASGGCLMHPGTTEGLEDTIIAHLDAAIESTKASA
jgi:hypothetical protein